MSEPASGIHPVLIIDAEALIASDPGRLELALAAGTPHAVRELVAQLARAASRVGQPVLVVIDERHVAEQPRRSVELKPSMRLRMMAVLTCAGHTREQVLREMVLLHVAEGIPVEFVTTQAALSTELDLLGGIAVAPAAFEERLARALARRRADRIRARQALADTDGLVSALVEASHESPKAEDAAAQAKPPDEIEEESGEDTDDGQEESKAA